MHPRLGCPVRARQLRDSRERWDSDVIESMKRRASAFLAALAMILLTAACAVTTPATAPARISLQAADAGDLASGLPTVLSFSDRMGTAVIASLDTPLDVTDAATPAEFRAGDVVYWEPLQSIIVFLHDGQVAPTGTHLIGHVDEGLGELAGCLRDCPVSFESRG